MSSDPAPKRQHEAQSPLGNRAAADRIGPSASSRLLGAVSPLMRSLMEAVDVESEIPRSLSQLGERLGLEGAALYEGESRENRDAETMSLCHLWRKSDEPGVQLPGHLRTRSIFGASTWQIAPRTSVVETEDPVGGRSGQDEGQHETPLHRTFVPILRGGNIVACLALFARQETRPFTNYESSLLTALASSFGGALLRQRAQDLVRQSELRYQRLFERNLAGVYRTTVEGRFLEANDALAHLLGLDSREDLLALDVHAFYPSGELRDEVVSELRQLGSITSREVQLRRQDGTPIWVLVNETLLDSGIIEGTLIDISDRKLAERRALRSEKLQSLGVLAGGIAHDFNNLLTSVLGNVSLAREIVRGQETLSRVLETIESATMRAQDMASQLLTFARGGEPIRRVVDVESSVLDAVQLSLTGSRVNCELDLAADIGAIFVDSGQWHQVLCNLLINGSQAMPDGGRICISGERAQLDDGTACIHLSIADEGPGIDRAILDKIFDPFFTTKKEGSGLGLATCHSVLERHGGRIDVELPREGGTAFHIWMPTGDVSEQEAVPVESGGEPMRGRLLLMDDREDVRDIGETMLGHLGFHVDSFEDGQDAVDAYCVAMQQGRRYDAIIMDLTVPGGMGGVEALRAIKELDPHVLAFVSSGYSSDPVMANYETEGFHGVIGKPYRLSDLRRALHPYFGERLG